jgi:hypothetical protein
LSLEGEESLREYLDHGETGAAVRRRFCFNCGSPLVSLVESVPDMAIIKAGTLTDRSWLSRTMHIGCDTVQPWVDMDEGMVQIPRNPPS